MNLLGLHKIYTMLLHETNLNVPQQLFQHPHRVYYIDSMIYQIKIELKPIPNFDVSWRNSMNL